MISKSEARLSRAYILLLLRAGASRAAARTIAYPAMRRGELYAGLLNIHIEGDAFLPLQVNRETEDNLC